MMIIIITIIIATIFIVTLNAIQCLPAHDTRKRRPASRTQKVCTKFVLQMYQIRMKNKYCLKIQYRKYIKIQQTRAVTCLYDEYLETWSTTQGHGYYPLMSFLRIWRQLAFQGCCCAQSFKTDHFDLNSSQSSVWLSTPCSRSTVIICWLQLSHFFICSCGSYFLVVSILRIYCLYLFPGYR